MRSFLLIFVLLNTVHALASLCDITAQYRCKSGIAGAVVGSGSNVEAAKINARDRARAICSGMVDYVRFADSSSTC